jgi:four helix bundle protein
MTKTNTSTRKYDLLQRTQKFAIKTRVLLRKLPLTITNTEDIKQLARSSGSVAANYIEANDSLSKKDFLYRIMVCRKEAKESILFFSLLDTGDNDEIDSERIDLVKEATELMKIFGSIVTKSSR